MARSIHVRFTIRLASLQPSASRIPLSGVSVEWIDADVIRSLPHSLYFGSADNAR
jgi:hypothetical protein